VTHTRQLILALTTVIVAVAQPARNTAYAFYDNESSLRLQVTPRETEVFVDGYLAGRVDDFDGRFQRLHVLPGEHELTLYLDGHRKVTQRLLVRPRASFRIRYTMVQLAAGETPDVRPPWPPAPRDAQPTGDAAAAANYGALAIRVQPADAEVTIDGQRWASSADGERLVVQLAAGAHKVEVRKDGFRSYTTQVDIKDGETLPINVSLSRGEGR
jgi:PEGA domain-containing protein